MGERWWGGLYRLCTLAASILLYVPFRMHARGRVRLSERYGSWGVEARQVWWFHGASAGEVQGLLPLIEWCRRELPGRYILVTATSPTGLEKIPDGRADAVRLLPFDHPIYLSRALEHLQLERVVSAETELWPELARILTARAVPLYLVNARMMERSFRWYRSISGLLSPIRAAAAEVLAADAASATRFSSLGFPRVTTVGNSKYDVAPRFERVPTRAAVRAKFSWGERPLIVLGSLRPGEEQFWFPVIQEYQSQGVCVVIAPRHRERFEWFAEQLEQASIPFQRASAPHPSSAPVLLLDLFGELERYYAAADLAFVGGTLIPIGGHNPLEPAMYGVPLVLGPYQSAIREVAAELIAAGGAIECSTVEELNGIVGEFLRNPFPFQERGAQAFRVHCNQRGAVERIVGYLKGAR